ncbi:MAG: hypothetical protein JNL74_23295 [Fibrobacteres bacterium]|nr:hypothetical protein [Fibrobacterota bacterium]
MLELRCPVCNASRLSVIGNLIFAGDIFRSGMDGYQPDSCSKCGHVFAASTLEAA